MINRFEKIDDAQFLDAYQKSVTKADLFKLLKLPVNGNNCKYVNTMYTKLGLTNKPRVCKYPVIISDCPICSKKFEAKSGSPKQKRTCSYACSNKLFRVNNKSIYIDGRSTYRKKALSKLPNLCNRCGYNSYIDILEVHHKDRNRKNNDISNLEILCPNCHSEEHYQSGDGRW
jgi:5-methylcytosine-specific restriction endonuclease McrA